MDDDKNTESFLQTVQKIEDINHIKKIKLQDLNLINKIGEGGQAKVYTVYNVAFDHKSKGFDNNNTQGCTGYIANCVSFNNNINYQLSYTFEKWACNWSWNPIKADQSKQSQGLHVQSNKSTATNAFYQR